MTTKLRTIIATWRSAGTDDDEIARRLAITIAGLRALLRSIGCAPVRRD